MIGVCPPFSVSVTAHAGTPVVALAGEADVTARAALGDVLAAEAARRPRLLVVDLSALRFIDSAALHVILQAHKDLRAAGCALALAGASGGVARVLELTSCRPGDRGLRQCGPGGGRRALTSD